MSKEPPEDKRKCPDCGQNTLIENVLPGPGKMVDDEGERIPDRGYRCTQCGYTKFDYALTLGD